MPGVRVRPSSVRDAVKQPRGHAEAGKGRRRGPSAHRGFEEPAPVVEVTGLSDQGLLDRAAEGEPVAFAELFRRHRDLAWRIAYAGTLSADDAVATVVEAFVHLHRGVRHESVAFPAFVAGIVRETAQDRMRRRRSVRPSLVSDELDGNDRRARPSGHRRRISDSDEPAALSMPEGEDELDLTDTDPSDSGRDPTHLLHSVVPSPPPELWALVHVAWNDYKGVKVPAKRTNSL